MSAVDFVRIVFMALLVFFCHQNCLQSSFDSVFHSGQVIRRTPLESVYLDLANEMPAGEPPYRWEIFKMGNSTDPNWIHLSDGWLRSRLIVRNNT